MSGRHLINRHALLLISNVGLCVNPRFPGVDVEPSLEYASGQLKGTFYLQSQPQQHKSFEKRKVEALRPLV